jgi:hypothetical protein
VRVNKIVDNWNEDHGTDIKILFLPVAHPHLNRIELIWSRIKERRLHIGELAHEKQASITAEDWERVYQRNGAFALGCMDVENCDDTTNLLSGIDFT